MLGISRLLRVTRVLGSRSVVVCIALLLVSPVLGTDFFVSPTGTTSTGPGTGTIANPWSLGTALAQPSAVQPGDTIWLRGGTYNGIFDSYLSGTPAAPVTLRQYPGERATIDGGVANTPTVLTIWGSYAWFWGFEITSSSSDRVSAQPGPSPTDLNRPNTAIQNAQSPGSGVGVKIINMVIHNCGQGIGLWQDASDSEAYGNLVYYNGWNAPGRTWGHGLYSQNVAPSHRTIRDNIFYANYDYNLHLYAETTHLDNHRIDGNIVFWDGAAASPPGNGAAMTMGGGASASGNVVTGNAFYGFPGFGVLDLSRGNQNVTMTGNMSGVPGGNRGDVYLDNQTGAVTITGNTFYGGRFQPSNYATLYPSNVWELSPGAAPSGSWILVRPNAYESGRGHVAIFNWSHAASVSVDLSSVLSVGSAFEIRNAQDYFGPVVLTGTYAGGAVAIPMTASSVELPAGAPAPVPTGPEFNAFVVITTGAVPPPPPVAAFSFSPGAPQTSVPVTFADASTGSPTTWRWDFGDGGTSTLRNPAHAYGVAGTYTITLIAANAGGSSQTTRRATVTAPPASATGQRLYPVPPCRAIDTRSPNGALGGPKLAANSTRVFPLAGACGIPSDAIAVSFNVTVTESVAQGQLRIYPGNTQPPPTSVISFRLGGARANNGIVVLATDGTGIIGVRNDASGAVHLIVDVNGYLR